MDTTFVKTYTAFVGILVSAKPEYLSMVLGKLSYGLTYRASLPYPAVLITDTSQTLECKH